MPLTDTAVRNSKPGAKTRRVFDERGLYLEISPAGGRWWRWKYRYGGKEKRLSLGVYPDVGLKDAREGRDDARKLLSQGVDPSANRKATKLAGVNRHSNSFEVVAREWFGKYKPNWVESHSSRIIRLFERDIFPHIGSKAIADVSSPDLLAVVRRIEARALETAHRGLRYCGQVFRYAVATGRCVRDPSADLRGALPAVKGNHFAATTEPKRLGTILQAMDGYAGTLVVQSALRLAPLVFVRPGELRHAKWADIDLEQAEWRYMVTKTKTPHIFLYARKPSAYYANCIPSPETARLSFQAHEATRDL
jgi:hypothetical protein